MTEFDITKQTFLSKSKQRVVIHFHNSKVLNCVIPAFKRMKQKKRGRVFVWGALSAHCACSVDGGGDDDKGRERASRYYRSCSRKSREFGEVGSLPINSLVYSYCGGKTYYRGRGGSKMSEDNSSLRSPFNEGAHT
ncbi:hypothetical protein CEXT_438851 [Caerostris extrusa]|uniref:Uncharacterized protein n=1 Tax=Caerostris extrusa TaxID=172846 RepID=A0AAV4VEU4_CAEEX|nr:hypothetical protein CEXT_438851 [Caerostris extrusa]